MCVHIISLLALHLEKSNNNEHMKEVKLRIQIYLFSEMSLKLLSSYSVLHVAHFTFIGFCFAFGIRIEIISNAF